MFFFTNAGIYLKKEKKKDKKRFLPKAAAVCAGTCGAARPRTRGGTAAPASGARGRRHRRHRWGAVLAGKPARGKLLEWMYWYMSFLCNGSCDCVSLFLHI